jgi:glycosyltransferase involved in cell wall biosynthesis
MNIVWFSWKDIDHPLAGGAELVSTEIRQRLVRDGHNVTLITSKPSYLKHIDQSAGVNIVRVGGRFSVYIRAWRTYRKKYTHTTDIVVDEMNTIPFFSAFYVNQKSKKYLLTYQLAREVWFYQMMFPLSFIGYILEPVYLKLISKSYDKVLTESMSTKLDLIKYGFDMSKIQIFRVGMEMKPATTTNKHGKDIMFLGSFRRMKRTLDAIKAFEYAKDIDKRVRLTLVGDSSGKYGRKVLNYIKNSRYSSDIHYLGRVSSLKKRKLLGSSRLILVTSIKEGWGLIITEANSQGTPAIAYDVDGLRDSVKNGTTGVLVAGGNPQEMGTAIADLIHDKKRLAEYSHNARIDSMQYTFENSYKDFKNILELK